MFEIYYVDARPRRWLRGPRLAIGNLRTTSQRSPAHGTSCAKPREHRLHQLVGNARDIMMQETENEAFVRPLLKCGTTLSVETREVIVGFAIVLLVTIIGMLLTLQGWKSRPPAFDMLTYFNSAERLLKTGTPARYGDVSSYGSFPPGGTTWLMAPGMLLFHDPRLYEKFGGTLLHLGTLLGVFLLARRSFGMRCAYLSVILYGLSGLGLWFAGSLYPIRHPFFYVWLAHFAVRWVTCRGAKYLAAA